MWGGKKKARFSQYLMGFEASKKQIAARLKQNGGDISGGWNLGAHEMQTGVWSATLATALRSDQNKLYLLRHQETLICNLAVPAGEEEL